MQQIAVSDNVYLFRPGDDIEKAAGAFERYDLISAPVVDDSGRVVGRATIDDIVEHMHESRERGLLVFAVRGFARKKICLRRCRAVL